MQKTVIIVVGFAIAATVFAQRSKQGHSARFPHLKGWQKVLGLAAVILTALVLLNPELTALGLLGDSTLFDVLALALSVQLLAYLQWGWRWLCEGVVRTMRWMGTPSPGLLYLMAVATGVLQNLHAAIQRILHQ